MELKSYFCKSLTEFYQISLKILPNLTDYGMYVKDKQGRTR